MHGCHGANCEGKSAMKAPAIKGTKLDADQLVSHLMTGKPTSKAPHKKGISGLNESQAKTIAGYVKSLWQANPTPYRTTARGGASYGAPGAQSRSVIQAQAWRIGGLWI
jgi:mono/diheme cytochrome c family protein